MSLKYRYTPVIVLISIILFFGSIPPDALSDPSDKGKEKGKAEGCNNASDKGKEKGNNKHCDGNGNGGIGPGDVPEGADRCSGEGFLGALIGIEPDIECVNVCDDGNSGTFDILEPITEPDPAGPFWTCFNITI